MNVILIALDTLAASHLGCYGYRRNTSPFLDRYSQEATLFENFFASGIPTQPSYTTTFSGRVPLDHGIVSHGGTADPRSDVVYIQEILSAHGYHTACVSALPAMREYFKKGWKEVIEVAHGGRYMQVVTAEQINCSVIPWLQKRRFRESFFLFLHYWDTHTPYLVSEDLRNRFYRGNPGDPDLSSFLPFEKQPFAVWWLKEKGEAGSLTGWITQLTREAGVDRITDAEYLVSQYDSELYYLDVNLAALFDVLREAGIEDNTSVLIMSDHGEEMYEHGIFFDHHGLYEANIHCPLIAKLPNQERGLRIKDPVRHEDIATTILELADIDIPAKLAGRSLLPFMHGETPSAWREDILIAEENTWMSKWALRRQGFKLIKARARDWHGFPPRELYNTASDPGETRNLVEAESELADEMDEELEARIKESLIKYGRSKDPLVEQGLSPMGLRAWEWIKEARYW
jgi:arylsulfatase